MWILRRLGRENGVRVGEVKTQMEFLLELGIFERAGLLGQGKSAEVQEGMLRG